jgi:hypothetical protein
MGPALGRELARGIGCLIALAFAAGALVALGLWWLVTHLAVSIAWAAAPLPVFTDEECRQLRLEAAAGDAVAVARDAVRAKWRELGGAVEPGDVAAALRTECRLFIPTMTEEE